MDAQKGLNLISNEAYYLNKNRIYIMSRGYPNFFYSKVSNPLENGHFVIKATFPKALFKVAKVGEHFFVERLESWEDHYDENDDLLNVTKRKILFWLKAQEHIVW